MTPFPENACQKDRALRDQATLAYLAAYEEEHECFTAQERRAAAEIWSRAEGREERWRDAD